MSRDILRDSRESRECHDFRSNKPSCYQFEAISKSLLLRNLTSKSSPRYNCEHDDGNNFILSKFNVFPSGTECLPGENDDEIYVQKDENDLSEGDNIQNIDDESDKHQVCASSEEIIRRIQRSGPSVKSCSECVQCFQKPSSIRHGSTCFWD